MTSPVITFLNTADYFSYKEDGNLQNWFGLYKPFDHTEISLEEMDRRANNVAFWDSEKFVVQLNCNIKYKDSNKFFWGPVLDALVALDPDPNNVRIVFWFDN